MMAGRCAHMCSFKESHDNGASEHACTQAQTTTHLNWQCLLARSTDTEDARWTGVLCVQVTRAVNSVRWEFVVVSRTENCVVGGLESLAIAKAWPRCIRNNHPKHGLHAFVCVCVRVCARVCACVCVCERASECTRGHVCVCVHTHASQCWLLGLEFTLTFGKRVRKSFASHDILQSIQSSLTSTVLAAV